MLCECGKHEATIHEVIITSDKKKVERHLCEFCARKQGVSSDPYIPIDKLISTTNYIMGQVVSGSQSAREESEGTVKPRPSLKPRNTAQACMGCGQTFSNFKKTGMLGCPACYQAFEDRIGPMIERAHEGGCNHVGKIPRRALSECRGSRDTSRIESLLGDVRQREERLETLRHRLAKSINDEEYEQAAMLRDELTRLTAVTSSQIEHRPAPAPASSKAPGITKND
ncbi:MAG: hypothetical protein WD114_06490 [Phycisphaerales bacterium]